MTFVPGQNKDNALGLLGAAEGLGLDPSVVVAVDGGFEAPDEVIEALESVKEPKTKTTSKPKATAAKKKEGEN